MAAATTFEQMLKVVDGSVSEIGLMEFMRLDHGAVLAKAGVEGNPKSVRLIMGNPLIMQSMARLVPDAGAYAPVTVLIDQRPDGVHLSYDEMASCLAPYGNAEALKIARDLDAKVKSVLERAS
jgi:uncharacterized protein (DUF302 family)